ncbi:hypothetical protein G6011_00968 [Alternaria panax]|uniref:P-loop containing nucleoside triphosphate hydrolase protein n=1 Tax=Alternaria panax TaxID=48097 RepID=A0AAD4NV66_9PLEO|nr:hypothetical protein G6011_00968 [Alternaria panax]
MQKQLTMLLFDKMLRGVSTGLEGYDNENGSETTDLASVNVISLVTLDTQQIGNCIREVYRGYEAVIKLVISGWFVQQLMGWESLLASIIMIALLFSGNALVAKQHARDQIDLMEEKDLRVAAITEALGGVRQIKLSGAEQNWSKHISQQREKELESLWAVNRWNMASSAICTMTPILLSVLVISTHVYVTGQLKASTAFTTLSIFGSINSTLGAIPQLQSGWIRALNSLERLEDYLYVPEKCFPSTDSDEISFRNATVCWSGSGSDGFCLKDITLSFPPGDISVIEGPSGSGKSLLIAAVLGECGLVSGDITKTPVVPYTPTVAGRSWPLDSSIAYVGQTPWIEAGTIMNNIMFGFPMQARRFSRVLHACALDTDLAALKDGDQTEIGPRGVNLSGGQRLRITLARALYSPAAILVLDDIFSAIDAHTALHIAENVLGGSLVQGRTVILASHHPSLYMPYADYIVSLYSGGQYECRYTERCGRTKPQKTSYTTNEMTSKRRRASSKIAASRHGRKPTVLSVASIEPFPISECPDVAKVYQYIENEQEQTFGSQHRTLVQYLQCMGNAWLLILVLSAYASYVVMLVGKSWWVARWVQQDEHATENSLAWYLGVYAVFAITSCVFGVGQNYLTYCCTLNASRRLFDMLLDAVLRAPMDFTERNPLGRIMNRFTSDTAILDEQIGQVLGAALTSALMSLAIHGVSTTVSWWILPMSIPMLMLCTYSANHFLQVARKLKHLENISRSPVLDGFCSTMDGLPTIRSMLLQERYIVKFATLVDDNTRALLNLWLINSWFGCRMALIGSVFVTMASLVIVSMPSTTVAMTGFALAFLIRYTDNISTFIRSFGGLELSLTSASRVIEYTKIPIENYSAGRMPPAAWPEEGRVQISNLVIRHAPHLPPALNGITFDIESNERVGVVGRTGAGKSTLAMAFFRILEAEKGSITLDGINISDVTLLQLRQRLSIITQDPHLFPGTVRSNLDPFSVHDDTDLLHALGRVHWPGSDNWFSEHANMASGSGLFSDANSVVPSLHDATLIQGPLLLDQPILDGGDNLSQGQRQQLSLARAIVDRAKLLIFDETTPSVDPDTDASIQKSIRELSACGFASMLVIAHRISTIMDFDKVIVLDSGVIVESGSPEYLLRLPGGYFRGLVEDSKGMD